MFKICALAFVVLNMLSGYGHAQEFSPRQQEIFKTTVAVDGYLTEKLHGEFWGAIKSSPAYYPGVERDISAALGPLILDGLDFQKETWASIEQSYAARSAVKTQGFIAARKKMESKANPAIRAAALPSLQKADTLIQAAAERRSYSSGAINLFITPELIEKVKTGLDASFFRVQLLANPVWDSKPREWHLKEAGLRVISALPFTYEQQDLALANGVSGKVSSYSLNVDGQNFLGLSSVKVAAKVDDSDATLIRIARNSMAVVGISAPTLIALKFRGDASAVATGQAQTASGPVYGSVRAVRPSARQDIVMFVAISTTSQIDADTNREGLELATLVE